MPPVIDLWKRYRRWIVLTVVLIGVLSGACHYWRHHQDLYNMRASMTYQGLFNAVGQNNVEAANNYLATLKKDFPRSGYAALGVLMEARFNVENHQYDAALVQLRWVIDHSVDHANFQQIARIRVARILLMQQKYSDALQVLTQIDDPEFKPLVDEVKGDIYLAQHNKTEAKKWYNDAISEFKAIDVQNQPLVRKVDAL